MAEKRELLSGNEAIALGAYHAGVVLAAAYPGTPSTEILENLAKFRDIYAEWSTNEKVAMEVAMGASYAGVRALASMKHVGLNVAADPFMAAAITGVNGGLVIISADDPGIHSSQNEQDNRHYARLAKIPVLEPGDSQEAYDLMAWAFDISEKFDTPVMFRSTTRISHSKSVVVANRRRTVKKPPERFGYDVAKYVMLPGHARLRRPLVEERLVKLAAYAETFPLNRIIRGGSQIGVVTGGVAYQYAREAFPDASFLKLGMSYPLPRNLLLEFAGQVEKLVVIEELDPFLEENIRLLGIEVTGKEFIPLIGELNSRIVEDGAVSQGLLEGNPLSPAPPAVVLPKRPPLLCPGCPHSGPFFVLNGIGRRSKAPEDRAELVITGDIGCYTLGTYPPLSAMDTCSCMGASIGEAMGMEKAGIAGKIVAVIGDSTFLHSGITGLVDAVYNKSKITVLILDNGTTAMTGHQEHPGTGVSAQGEETNAVDLEKLVRGVGVAAVSVISAYDIKALRKGIRNSLDKPELSVVIVRGSCAMHTKNRANPRSVDTEKCNQCGSCLLIGCPAIQSENGQVFIDAALCMGDACGICQQVCPHRAIVPMTEIKTGVSP
ncbi:indolepyruvate ferredoxin oxidoreductase subunit alpha [Chloroflexota bacterium]